MYILFCTEATWSVCSVLRAVWLTIACCSKNTAKTTRGWTGMCAEENEWDMKSFCGYIPQQSDRYTIDWSLVVETLARAFTIHHTAKRTPLRTPCIFCVSTMLYAVWLEIWSILLRNIGSMKTYTMPWIRNQLIISPWIQNTRASKIPPLPGPLPNIL